MGMETTGRIHVIGETKQVSAKFSKRELVVEIADNPKYPQTVPFELTGDRCSRLDEFQVGDQVRVEFNLRGREWRSPAGEVKYFLSLDVWRIDHVGGAPRRGSSSSSRAATSAPPSGSDPDSDIPF